ncbi:RING-H2 finger protein ATL7 [Forsythia ovata]|uniref:RING-H2 finger protein ATL7 n=1 Tax=Forsythia ovata TaxID=205694 RepID=A0ABD1U5N7_9LAMI
MRSKWPDARMQKRRSQVQFPAPLHDFLFPDYRCSVCLADYQSDDKLQQIPACGHTFHMDCIDLWLATHTTCPLCRQSLLASSKAPDGGEEEDIQVETNNRSETSLGIISQSIEDDPQTSQQPLESSNADKKESLQPATACEEGDRVS